MPLTAVPHRISRWIAAAVLLGAAGLATAGAVQAATMGIEQCVTLQKARGAEYLVNSCGTCQTVEVERLRPGMDRPTQHSYTLPTRAPLQLSFRGPGDTRLRAQKACDGPSPAPTSSDGNACVSLQRTAKAGVVLFNSCGTCRLAVVERLGLASNDPNAQRPYTIAARAHMPLRAEGATGARIFTDGPCPTR